MIHISFLKYISFCSELNRRRVWCGLSEIVNDVNLVPGFFTSVSCHMTVVRMV